VGFSVALAKHRTVHRAIATIAEDAWTPVHYPGAVVAPDTGELISDAEVAEVPFTAFAATTHPVTARLIVRRVRDQARGDELFPVWGYLSHGTSETSDPLDQFDLILARLRSLLIRRRCSTDGVRTPRHRTRQRRPHGQVRAAWIAKDDLRRVYAAADQPEAARPADRPACPLYAIRRPRAAATRPHDRHGQHQ
jgi:hypothetical protein